MVYLHGRNGDFLLPYYKENVDFLKSKSSVKMLFFGLLFVQERKWEADDGCTGKADTGNADEGQRL